jgi:hypothetical protein
VSAGDGLSHLLFDDGPFRAVVTHLAANWVLAAAQRTAVLGIDQAAVVGRRAPRIAALASQFAFDELRALARKLSGDAAGPP